MTLKAWLGCLGVAVCVAAACSSSDGKKAVREVGGASGGDAEAGSGGGPTPEDGGSGGSATAGMGASSGEAGAGAVPGEAGAGGALPGEAGAGGALPGEAGAGGTVPGAGGAPSVPVELEAVQGTWSGHVLGSYVCESSLQEIALTIEGSSVTSTFPSVEDLGTGEIVHRAGQSFTFGLFIDNPSFNQNYRAQLFVDPTATYALFVAINYVTGELGNSVDVALLQRTELTPLDATPSDYFGDWSGPTFALDTDFAVARELAATATFSSESNLDVTGQDDDGPFNGAPLEEGQFAAGAWVAPRMSQAPNLLGGMFLLSNDKQAMAVALLREFDETDGALCHLNDPFADMSVHKFGLWTKVP